MPWLDYVAVAPATSQTKVSASAGMPDDWTGGLRGLLDGTAQAAPGGLSRDFSIDVIHRPHCVLP